MAIDLRLPKISAPTAEGQMAQMQSYMYQLVEQLNWALNTVNEAVTGDTTNVEMSGSQGNAQMTEEEAANTFNALKALIIKSGDIIEAYQEKMQLTFDGIYTAQSDFGAYQEVTNQQLTLQSNQITQNYTQLELIDEQLRKTNAWIRTGELDTEVWGVEVGRIEEVGGVETIARYARFTDGGIYFFLPGNDDPVAWMTGQKLYITQAQITGSLYLGGYHIDVDQNGGIAFKWGGIE